MKRMKIFANKLDTFLRYHEDSDNYNHNEAGFDKMYDILDKYDTSNGEDSVDVVFQKATPEDQVRMIELIKPKLKPGDKGYVRNLYHQALEDEIDNADSEYCEGVVDVIEALFAEGLLDENKFRTDI